MQYVTLNFLLSVFFFLSAIFVGEKALEICRKQNELFVWTGVAYEDSVKLDTQAKNQLENIKLDALPYGMISDAKRMGPIIMRLDEDDVLQKWTEFRFEHIEGLFDYMFEKQDYQAIDEIMNYISNSKMIQQSRVCSRTDLCGKTSEIPESAQVTVDQFLTWVDKAYFQRSEKAARRADIDVSLELWNRGMRLASAVDTDWWDSGDSDGVLDRAIIVGAFLEEAPRPTREIIESRILSLSNIATSGNVYDDLVLPYNARKFNNAIRLANNGCHNNADIELKKIMDKTENGNLKGLVSFVRVRNRYLNLTSSFGVCEGEPEDWDNETKFVTDAKALLKLEYIRQGYKTDIIQMIDNMNW